MHENYCHTRPRKVVKSGFIFVRPPSQPADRLTLKSWDEGEKEKMRKGVIRTEGKKDRPRLDLEGGPAQPSLFFSLIIKIVGDHLFCAFLGS